MQIFYLVENVLFIFSLILFPKFAIMFISFDVSSMNNRIMRECRYQIAIIDNLPSGLPHHFFFCDF